MDREQRQIGKHISGAYRMGQIFYDNELAPFSIGSGQQFFLVNIAQAPGITLLELAQNGYFDKGTTARAVHKLEEAGYIRVEADQEDRRLRKLFVTEKAGPLLKATRAASRSWQNALTQGMTEEECALAEQLLERMAENAYARISLLKGKRENEWNK